MSRDQDHSTDPVTDCSQLVEYIAAGCKTGGTLGVGTEHEKFGGDAETLAPITYGGQKGLGVLFGRLVDEYGWEPEHDNDRIMAVVRDGGALTLEPGGQFELSGRITETIHETADEIDQHFEELAALSAEMGIVWLGAGCQPFTPVADIPQVPKTRYGLMAPFLLERGDLAHHMMRATCTVQANLDYTSEADCAEMVCLSARLSPIVNATFANSRVVGGAVSDFASFRCHIWTRTDPARCGTPDFMLDGSFTFQKYAEWVVEVPMIFIKRDGAYLDAGGVTFRHIFEDGFQGQPATLGDWELHISTVFPDIRVKQFIEVRGADGGGRDAILAVPALWRGLLYDPTARAEADALIGSMSPAQFATLYEVTCGDGLAARYEGRAVSGIATELLEIAARGLDRLAGPQGSEAVYLEPALRWARSMSGEAAATPPSSTS